MEHSLDFLLASVTGKFKSRIARFCDPLQSHFGIKHFSYHKVTKEGHYSFLSNLPDWMDYYFSNKYYLKQPHLKTPDYISTGISLPRLIRDEAYQEMMQTAEKRDIYFSLVMIKNNGNHFEYVGFDLNSPDPNQLALLLDNIKLIQVFINHFKNENSHLLKLLDENRVDIKEMIGSPFFAPPTSPLQPKKIMVNQFLHDIELAWPTELSERELQLLNLIARGYPAGQIGLELFLSKRTVEHYTERLKNKLNCYSKAELIQKARQLESIDFI